MTNYKSGISQSVNGSDGQLNFLNLDCLNYLNSYKQQIWWDTFPIDKSLCVEQKFGDSEKQRFNPYSKAKNRDQMWF